MKDQDAVSPVVGIILLLGIVAALASIAFIFIQPPEARETYDVAAQARVTNGDVWVTNLGPDDLPVDEIRVLVKEVDQTTTYELEQFTGSMADPKEWKVGEKICVSGIGASCPGIHRGALSITLATPNDIIVSVESHYGDSFKILGEGGIRNDCAMSWTMRIVGVAITYGSGGPDIPVYVNTTRTGGAPFNDIFGGQNVSGGETYNFGVVQPGETLAVQGTASYGSFHSQWSSADDDPHVVTLIDGDPVPQHPGYGTQVPVGDLLAPYEDGGYIDIAPNEVMVLFEFTSDLNSSAADFQDLVVILRSQWAGC